MRQIENQQVQFGEMDIASIKIDIRSRDDIPKLLLGLQYIYTTKEIRDKVFNILKKAIPENVDFKNGRPGMNLWKILVLGSLRLNLNCDYDHVVELANNHKTLRELLGHGILDQNFTYKLQTTKDNISLLAPEILDEINQIVVKEGHKLIKKREQDLRGKCDSFVAKTNVHYPTDINLLFDAIRKVICLTAVFCKQYGVPGWGKSAFNVKKIKKLFRHAQKMKYSTSKDPKKIEKQEKAVIEAHQAYLMVVEGFLERVNETFEILKNTCSVKDDQLWVIDKYIVHAYRQIDQTKRRVNSGETIPHDEKVFSVFEEHTEWISKGKAGVPVELGLRVCVMEDQYGFILHHKVMQQLTDDKVAVSMVRETQERFHELVSCSYDKGFHSPENQEELRKLLRFVVLPKKGKLSERDKQVENAEEFVSARKKHSAVESAINALGVHGLDICPDHGIEGFKRYVSLAVLGRNIQQLGTIIKKKKLKSEKRKTRLRKSA